MQFHRINKEKRPREGTLIGDPLAFTLRDPIKTQSWVLLSLLQFSLVALLSHMPIYLSPQFLSASDTLYHTLAYSVSKAPQDQVHFSVSSIAAFSGQSMFSTEYAANDDK